MKNSPPIPGLSLVLLAALAGLSRHAITFPLPEPAPAMDSLHASRAGFIIFGLVAFALSVVELVVIVKRHGWKLAVIAPAAAVTIACFVIGWRIMPYWVLGIYQHSISGQPWRDMDPKSHMPMIWIGELWRIPILLFQFLPLALVPGGLVVAGLLLWRRQFLSAAITIFGLATTACFFIRAGEDYMGWLLD